MTQQTIQQKKNTSQTEVNFQPLGNRLLVKRLAAQETLKGGIILPETAKKKQEAAEVVALGAGKLDKQGKLIPIPLKKGDVILMDKYSGQEITLNDQEYIIVKMDDVIAKIEE